MKIKQFIIFPLKNDDDNKSDICCKQHLTNETCKLWYIFKNTGFSTQI